MISGIFLQYLFFVCCMLSAVLLWSVKAPFYRRLKNTAWVTRFFFFFAGSQALLVSHESLILSLLSSLGFTMHWKYSLHWLTRFFASAWDSELYETWSGFRSFKRYPFLTSSNAIVHHFFMASFYDESLCIRHVASIRKDADAGIKQTCSIIGIQRVGKTKTKVKTKQNKILVI